MISCFRDIRKLHMGQPIDEGEMFAFIDYINARKDCSDFRLLVLLKAYCAYGDLLSTECKRAIESCAVDFKYFLNEPGKDSMCFWSENHYVLFAACEYLAGQLFPTRVFSNNGKSGQWHQENADRKLKDWLEQKYKYGFIEWYSNVYYTEDIAPLCVLTDHAKDASLVTKCTMVLNLLMLDLALQSYQGNLCSSMGRSYEKHILHTDATSAGDIFRCAFYGEDVCDGQGLSMMFLLRQNYRVPRVIGQIALCREPMQLKTAMGFDFDSLKAEIPDGVQRAVLLWQMEAFTNPEAIESSMDLFGKWHLQDSLLKDLGKLNIPILRKLHLLPLVSRILKPVTDGTALLRADVLTVKAEGWLLSTAQNYHPYTFGDQQHIWHACLPENIDIFSTHPACPLEEAGMRSQSPSYWVGNGILPFAVQHDNVLLLDYKLNVRKGFMEKKRQKMVHFSVPFARLDEQELSECCFCGRKGDSYLAILSSAPMEAGCSELMIPGTRLRFAVILGDKARYGSFEKFQTLVHNAVLQTKCSKTYLRFGDDRYEAKAKKYLRFNGKMQPLRYDRLDTPFVKAKRGDDSLHIAYQGHSLYMRWSSQEIKEECIWKK